MSQPTENNKKFLPYGSWPSIMSAELIVSDNVSFDEPKLTANSIYFIERRPQENGRCVIVKLTNNKTTDILPEPYSARSHVHEYGGGCYCVDDEFLFFINNNDQDIYCIKNNQVTPVTTTKNKRFADFIYDKRFHRLIAICETHNDHSVTNAIVSIDVTTGQIITIEQGNDFYASPRLNSAADKLCWQSWNHPNMPWDGNQLYIANINHQGQIIDRTHIAGADDISVFQPQWSPDDILYFISDDSGWWHLYRYHDTGPSSQIEQLTRGEKEFGLPQWVFAQSTYAFINNRQILCCYQSQGKSVLASLSLAGQATLTPITMPWQEYSSITSAKNMTGANRVCFIAASKHSFPQLISATVHNNETCTLTTSVVKTSCQLPIAKKHYSKAQTINFTNRHKQKVYANYYPAINPAYHAKNNELPPLIVICHGGPTGQTNTALDPKKQFWTSRGFALLDVNYSGSTGYGREYRLRLNNKWGQLDVEDCCEAANYAVSQGLADKNHLIIRGSSAGGYTVLSALSFQQVFSAGASYYGISELSSLASDTHKFESFYLDRLIGPYPEAKALYEQRSPINSTDQLNCPVIFFQGIEDKVVAKEQAEKMFEALDKKGLPVAAQYFSGEQHGFRKAETIIQSLENELSFYQLVFKLKPKDEISFKGDIQIKNI
ncbi:MAG: prolyl oligopeptidase family serine peptidase [Gammaproteobacteria bacterium]|nr:prolyl oligopeptidase family serine peptidase [Gammaproteobacteria bacterium]